MSLFLQVLLNVNTEHRPKLVLAKPTSSISIVNMSRELSYSNAVLNRTFCFQSSNLNLSNSRFSLNALDLDNMSFSSFDRHSLYSNCSDYLYIVEPLSELTSTKGEIKVERSTDELIGQDLNKTFKNTEELDMCDGRINGISKKQHDKVTTWLLNT